MVDSSVHHMNRRTLLFGVAAAALSTAACSHNRTQPALSLTSGAACWPSVEPPQAPRIDKLITQFGRERNDPYAWMKFIPEKGVRTMSNLPEMLRTHLEAEAAYADTMLGVLERRQQDFMHTMLARSASTEAMPPLRNGAWRYTTVRPQGSSHPVHMREHEDGTSEVLVDERARAEGHAYYRASEFQPSPDHRYFAWAEDIVGILEGYHVQRLHRNSIGQLFADVPNVTDVLGLSIRQISGKVNFTPAALDDEDENIHKTVTHAYQVFPNCVVVTSPYYISVMLLMPRGPGRTTVEYFMLTPEAPSSEKAEALYSKSYELILIVFGGEDFWAAEMSQAGLASGALDKVVYSGLEETILTYYDLLESRL